MSDTGWAIDKLQKVKKSLQDKGLLRVVSRYNEDRQTSNVYYVTTDLIGAYVGGDKLSGLSESDIPEKTPPPYEKTVMDSPLVKPTTEVLTINEVLLVESKDSTEETLQRPLFPVIEKPIKKKKEKQVDESFDDLKNAWIDAYPDLGFSGVSGKMINLMIKHTRSYLINAGKPYDRERILGLFQYVLSYVARERHFAHGKPITTFQGQYLSIIREIKDGKNKQQGFYSKNSADRFSDFAG